MLRNASLRWNHYATDMYKVLKICLLLVIFIFSYIAWLRYDRETGHFNLSLKIPLGQQLNSFWRTKDTSKKTHFKNTFNIHTPKKSDDNNKDKGRGKSIATLKNITRDVFTHRLVTSVKDEPYLTQHGEYFKANSFVDNRFRHEFILDGQNVCEEKNSPHLLILLPSRIEDEPLRNAIRQTWMNAAETNQWPRFRVDGSIRHVFFLGLTTTTSSDEDMRAVQNESKSYGDIVLADFKDTYGNLSRKMVTALQWVDKHCPGVRYVLKCDQDTFINVPLLLRYLTKVEVKLRLKRTNFVMGRTHSAQPKVERKGRWAVKTVDYSLQHFPIYAYGHSYIIGGAAIPALLSVANEVPLIAPEDAFVTGILPKVAGVKRLHAECFTVCCRDIFDCEIVWNQYVSMTAALRPLDHHRMWKAVKTGICHPNTLFNFITRGRKSRKRDETTSIELLI